MKNEGYSVLRGYVTLCIMNTINDRLDLEYDTRTLSNMVAECLLKIWMLRLFSCGRAMRGICGFW